MTRHADDSTMRPAHKQDLIMQVHGLLTSSMVMFCNLPMMKPDASKVILSTTPLQNPSLLLI